VVVIKLLFIGRCIAALRRVLQKKKPAPQRERLVGTSHYLTVEGATLGCPVATAPPDHPGAPDAWTDWITWMSSLFDLVTLITRI